MKNIKNEEKFKCVCSSKNIVLENNKYIHSSKFISNDSFIILNDKNIINYIIVIIFTFIYLLFFLMNILLYHQNHKKLNMIMIMFHLLIFLN